MNKIFLIIQREYITRVKKRSFIVMTLLAPILMAGVFMIPVLIAQNTDQSVDIQVIDEGGFEFKDTEKIRFENSSMDFEGAKKDFRESGYYAILYVPHHVLKNGEGVVLYAGKDVSLSVKDRISRLIETQLYSARLASRGINRDMLDSLRSDVEIITVKATDEGEKTSNSVVATVIGFAGGFLIYFFIFLYGMQVMRGVMEEKTNRIVEVIISSVRPFELMMGKIIGVAMVGLTQFLLWVILTITLTTLSATVFTSLDHETAKSRFKSQGISTSQEPSEIIAEAADPGKGNVIMKDILEMLAGVNYIYIVCVFVFYFLGGYLLYSALFAAIGAAVDSESDTQQFMLPVTIPLILSFIIAQAVVTTNPDSAVAFWFSIIPFTAPVVMMVRVPFEVPIWELALSMSLMVVGFFFTTWIAARIYRTGILMYGKKVNYRELSRWLFYKG